MQTKPLSFALFLFASCVSDDSSTLTSAEHPSVEDANVRDAMMDYFIEEGFENQKSFVQVDGSAGFATLHMFASTNTAVVEYSYCVNLCSAPDLVTSSTILSSPKSIDGKLVLSSENTKLQATEVSRIGDYYGAPWSFSFIDEGKGINFVATGIPYE